MFDPRDLINSTSFFYCKTDFSKVKVNPSLDDWQVRYCARRLKSRLRVWLIFERVASSVSTGELRPCAQYATSTPQACNAREACDSIWAMFTIHLERKIRTWRASSNSAMLLLESELESSFAPRYLLKKDEYLFCCSIEDDKYATICAAMCLIQLKTLHITSTTHYETVWWRDDTRCAWTRRARYMFLLSRKIVTTTLQIARVEDLAQWTSSTTKDEEFFD